MEATQDTSATPVVDGQVADAPTPEVAPVVIPEPVIETPPEPPLEDRMMQKFQSWQGRRDAQLREEFQNQINQVVQAVQSRNAQTEEAPDYTTQLLNDPMGFVDKVIDQKWNQRITSESQKTQSFITSAARIMDSDPDFADQALGMEVIDRIRTMNVNPNLPPDVAADLIVSKAKAQVLSQRVQKKVNPLSANRPATVPLGSVSPSSTPAPTKPSVKVDDEVRAYGKKLGMTDEEIDAEFMKG